MEIAFAFLFVAMLCWMVWVERKYAKRIRQRLHRLDKVLKKLEEKVK
ncbi:hypothetical protein ES703_73322 [subsurface metagenome]